MGQAAVQQELFPPGEPDHESNVVGIFDGSAIPKGVLTWLVHIPPGVTPETAAARAMPGTEFYHHPASPAIDRVTEFGNLLVGGVNALVNPALRDRFSFNLKLCPACIVDSQQASTLAFVMSEILIDALQYAHPTDGRIVIKIICAPGRDSKTNLDISDDGVGLPRDFEENFDARGVMLIRFKLQKAGAGMDFGSDALGLSYRIVLPPPEAHHAIFHAPRLNFGTGVH